MTYPQPQPYQAAPAFLPPVGPGEPFDGARDAEDLTRPLYGATFMQASKRFFKSYARFSGRASLSEYWWAQLMIAILMLPFLAVYIAGFVVVSLQASSYAYDYDTTGYGQPGGLVGGGTLALVGVGLLFLFSLAILVPSYAIGWRRMHDSGKSGAMYLLSLIPYAGGVIMIVLALQKSKPEGRQYDLPGTGYAPAAPFSAAPAPGFASPQAPGGGWNPPAPPAGPTQH